MPKPILLLDSTGNILREFDSYKEANQFRLINNRYDWSITSRKAIQNNCKYYS